jgi:G3E family GTPase
VEAAIKTLAWSEGLKKEHLPETEEYVISSFVFRARKPFQPERLWFLLNALYPESIIRTKGMFWLASRPAEALFFSQAGGSSQIPKAGAWWGSMPFQNRLSFQSFVDNQIEKDRSKKWQDSKQELVII